MQKLKSAKSSVKEQIGDKFERNFCMEVVDRLAWAFKYIQSHRTWGDFSGVHYYVRCF